MAMSDNKKEIVRVLHEVIDTEGLFEGVQFMSSLLTTIMHQNEIGSTTIVLGDYADLEININSEAIDKRADEYDKEKNEVPMPGLKLVYSSDKKNDDKPKNSST